MGGMAGRGNQWQTSSTPSATENPHTLQVHQSHNGILKRFIGNVVLVISILKDGSLCVPNQYCRTETIYSGSGSDFGKVPVPYSNPDPNSDHI
jgi:hypothetical protein